jgi:hypothetical protein
MSASAAARSTGDDDGATAAGVAGVHAVIVPKKIAETITGSFTRRIVG